MDKEFKKFLKDLVLSAVIGVAAGAVLATYCLAILK